MYTDLKSLIQSLLELVVKQDVLSQCKTGIQMKELDLCNNKKSSEFERHKFWICCVKHYCKIKKE